MNTGWWEIDIHDCYSLVKIAFAPICACKNNRQIWRHNASISRSRDVTDPLRWRHNAKSETTVLGDSYREWRFLGHSWCDLPMIFTRDFVTRENHRQIASLVTQKSLFTVTHALFFISSSVCVGVRLMVKFSPCNKNAIKTLLAPSRTNYSHMLFPYQVHNMRR